MNAEEIEAKRFEQEMQRFDQDIRHLEQEKIRRNLETLALLSKISFLVESADPKLRQAIVLKVQELIPKLEA